MTPPSDRAAQNRRATRIAWLCLTVGAGWVGFSGWLSSRWPLQFWTVIIIGALGGLWWLAYLFAGGRDAK